MTTNAHDTIGSVGRGSRSSPGTGGGQFLTGSVRPGDVFVREDLSEEQRMFGQTAAEFMRQEVLPREQQLYAHDWGLTRELLQKAAALDLTRLEIPAAYGGLGLNKISATYVGEQIAVNPSFAGSIGAHTSIGTLPIVYFGTDEQKARYLPRLGSAELIGAYALTETHSGSDALAARTTARLTPDGKQYLLNGQKMWITNGGFADLFTIFAKVDGDKFTAFIVERGMGVVSGRDELKLGLDGSSTTALMLDNVAVPIDNVLGTIGEGHKVAFNTLNLGRVKLGTRNIAGARQALNHAVAYARERRQFGRAISDFGLVKQKLGEIAVRIWVGDAMVFRALGDVDRALEAVPPDDSRAALKAIEAFAVECSINKVWTSEALAYAVDEAVQVFGGNGYSREFPVERAYRDARITRIYEGTNEINRLIIPTRLLKQSPETFTRASARRVLAARDKADEVGPPHNLRQGRVALRPDQTALTRRSAAADRPGSPPKREAKAEGGPHISPLAVEHARLAGAKVLAAAALGYAADTFGDRLKDEQELLGHTADIVSEVYAIESAVARADKLWSSDASGRYNTPVAIVRVYTNDAADRIAYAAKRVVAALTPVADVADLADAVSRWAARPSIDAISARRVIADEVIAAGRYPF